MGNRSFRFLTDLIITLFFSTLFSLQTFAQQVPVSKVDSLKQLIDSDVQDTSKLIHMNELSWELLYENPDTSILIANEAIELSMQVINKLGKEVDKTGMKNSSLISLAKANNNLGVCYEFMGDYVTSIFFHQRALRIRNLLNDKIGMGISLNNLGNVYDSQGNYIVALNYYLKSSVYFIEAGNIKRIAGSFNNIGIEYQRMNDYDMALEYFSKAAKMFVYMDNQNNLAQVYTNIAMCYDSKNNKKEALKYYLDALDIESENQNTYNISILYYNLGSLYLKNDELDSAEKYLSMALELHQAMGITYGVADGLGALGRVETLKGNYPAAVKFLKEGLDLSTQIGALELIKINNAYLSDLYSRTGQFDLAYKHHVEFTNIKDSLFNDEKSKELGKLETKYEMELAERDRVARLEREENLRIQNIRRKNLLQYSAISFILVLVGFLMLILGRVKVKPSVASAVTFFAFLLFFEFMLVLMDPTIDRWSKGEPMYKLLFNAGIAACIFPIHAFFERMLKKKLIRNNPN